MLLSVQRGCDFMCFDVNVSWDNEAGVWCAICDDIPLALESNSFDALIARVKIATLEILDLNNKNSEDTQLCFITAHKEKVA